ncbi:Tetratricopeptide repeat-containing protein isoform 3 [Cladophialophora immunda]|nr:Tetratricopeptide repeat-containing protein isoform 3 [Cladophialophora immunda]
MLLQLEGENVCQLELSGENPSRWLTGCSGLVPYAENPRFSGREAALKKLDEYLEPRLGSQRRVALYGLGGVGKTQIALKYAYRIRNDYEKVSIFWVHANSREKFHQSYLLLAKELDIPGADSHQVDKLAVVSEWLSRERVCGQWLMILQNADDVSMFQDRPADQNQETFAAKVTDYIPSCQHGALLITARDKNVGEALDAINHQILAMDLSESVDMLAQILHGDQYTRDDFEKLAHCLERVPLAMSQAAAYISKNSMRISDFLQMFEKRANALDILARDVKGVDRSVTATWQMSFTQIREQNCLAADILSLMAFLDRNDVLDTLITSQYENTSDTQFEDALGLLKAFSLIQETYAIVAGEEHRAYSMQHMVQLVTRHWLASQSAADTWAEKALFAVARVFPPGEHEDWEKCEVYLPHVRVVLDVEIKSKAGTRTKAELQYHSSSFFRVKGYHARAEEMARQSIINWKEALGPDNASTLASYTSLSRILLEQGQIEAAKEVQVEGLKAAEPGVKETDPAMLRARRHLAALDGLQGKFEDAYNTLLAVTEKSQINPGRQHADTLRATRDLAVTLAHLGRYNEAKALLEEVLEIRRQVLGAENLETLISMFDLAELYKLQDPENNAARAAVLEREVVRVRETTLGEEHPATILAMESLADSLRWQNRYEEAAGLGKKIEEILSKPRRKPAQEKDHGHPKSAPLHTMSYKIQTYKLPQPPQRPWPQAVQIGGLPNNVKPQRVSVSNLPAGSSPSSSSGPSSPSLSPPAVKGDAAQRRKSNPVDRILVRFSHLKAKVGAAYHQAK